MNSKKSLSEDFTNQFADDNIIRGERGGIEVEKGVVLTEKYLEKNINSLEKIMGIFTAYPDCYLDCIKPVDSNFTLFFYQRITLRAVMRYKEVYVTAPRAFSKSFITILGLMLQCIFMPGERLAPLYSVRSIA